ncbi:MAG: SIR2 family protein [Actinomycetota bacterium]|nr:SIR2 family protein [Nitrospiraceae bacterium]MDA8157197.1 SIR2 family protein [Actinomycetota bacterium]
MKELKDIIFFTGAGFSKPAACKMSMEMLADLQSLSNDGNSIFTQTERKTIKFILSCLYYHAQWRSLETDGKYSYQPNIEEFAMLLRRIQNRENLLPYPVTGNWSDKIIQLEYEFRIENRDSELDLYDSIERKIKTHCYPNWLNVNNTDFLNPMVDFFRDKPGIDTKLEWFTLNNDLVLEEQFKNDNSVYTGFVSQKWVGFDKTIIGEDTYNAGRINYYKLHGSIDWLRMNDGTVRKINQSIDETEIDTKTAPFLIFGHGTKLFTIDPFFSLLKIFHDQLHEKRYFFIIGYSFFDPHVNNLIFNELMTNPDQDKKIIVVNPKMPSLMFNDVDFEKRYGFDKILKKESTVQLVNLFKDIQKNNFYSDMPEFNMTQISTESLVYINCSGEEFISKMFTGAEGAYGITALIESLRNEAQGKGQQF